MRPCERLFWLISTQFIALIFRENGWKVMGATLAKKQNWFCSAPGDSRAPGVRTLSGLDSGFPGELRGRATTLRRHGFLYYLELLAIVVFEGRGFGAAYHFVVARLRGNPSAGAGVPTGLRNSRARSNRSRFG